LRCAYVRTSERRQGEEREREIMRAETRASADFAAQERARTKWIGIFPDAPQNTTARARAFSVPRNHFSLEVLSVGCIALGWSSRCSPREESDCSCSSLPPTSTTKQHQSDCPTSDIMSSLRCFQTVAASLLQQGTVPSVRLGSRLSAAHMHQTCTPLFPSAAARFASSSSASFVSHPLCDL
jgi:hypothetical protein